MGEAEGVGQDEAVVAAGIGAMSEAPPEVQGLPGGGHLQAPQLGVGIQAGQFRQPLEVCRHQCEGACTLQQRVTL